MTEREKILQSIKAGHEKASDYFHKEAMAILKQGKSYSSKDRTKTFEEFVADTLIENGIGDIAEWKKRAEIAEKEREEYRNSNRIVLRGLEIIKRNILRYCATDFPNILQQAEKELQEERKQ